MLGRLLGDGVSEQQEQDTDPQHGRHADAKRVLSRDVHEAVEQSDAEAGLPKQMV